MRICMLGAGFNADFYTAALHRPRSKDQVTCVYSRTLESAQKFSLQSLLKLQRICVCNLMSAVDNHLG